MTVGKAWRKRMKWTSINQDLQKENNISVVMHALRANDRCTRTALSELTGLTQATITKIVGQLIDWGAVSEIDSIGGGVGRRAICLHLNTEKYLVAAVRINRKYINLAVYDMDGRLYDMEQLQISFLDGVQGSMERLIARLREMLGRVRLPVQSIGVAVPGPFNYRTGRISLMSGFSGWNEIDIKGRLESAFALPVYVDQDANCGALAELWFAESESASDMLFICADRGIGAGLILNSSLYRGAKGFAGEFGHASINVFGPRCECGNRGCLELYGSTTALESTYRQEIFDPLQPSSVPEHISSQEIMALVRAGDPVACRAYSKTVGYLGVGVVGLINALNPSEVVFSDKLIQGGELFLEVIRATLRQYLLAETLEGMRVKVCELDGDPMLLGASVMAFDEMLRNPLTFFKPRA